MVNSCNDFEQIKLSIRASYMHSAIFLHEYTVLLAITPQYDGCRGKLPA